MERNSAQGPHGMKSDEKPVLPNLCDFLMKNSACCD